MQKAGQEISAMAGGHCLAKFALLWINPITGVRPESVADFFGSAARQSKTLELRTDSIGPDHAPAKR
ncbi:MAG: hypothetical protein CML24_13235 [Rhizobiales bacterium]|nr:hypothetical protein [Hyphomicrobiales bacterium]